MFMDLPSGETYIESHTNDTSDTLTIFIHGNSHSLKTFFPLLSLPELSHFSLLSYDLYGHGDSVKQEIYDYNLFVSQLKEIIFTQTQNQIFLIGHSLGGHIILQTLDQLPDTVKGVICFGTPPIDYSGELPFLANPALQFLSNENLNKEQAIEIFQCLHNRTVRSSDKSAIEGFLQTDNKFRKQFFPNVMAGHFKDEMSQLNQTKIPIKFYYGKEDTITSFDYINARQFDYSILNDLCHNFHYETPQVLAEAIISLIRKTGNN